MSDFRVKVIAEIDWSKLETTCDKKITLTNVDFDKSAISKAFSNVKITFDSSSFSTLRSDIESKLKNIKLSFDTSSLDKAINSAMNKSAKKSSQAAENKINQSDYVKQTSEQLDKLEKRYKGFLENYLNKSSNTKTGELYGDQISESLSKAQEQIENLKKSLKDNPMADSGFFDQSMNNLRSSLEGVNTAMESARKSVSELYRSFSEVSSGSLDKKIAEVKAAYEKMGAENNVKMDAEIGDTVARLDELRDSLRSAMESGDTSAIVSSFHELNNAITESTNGIKKFKAEQGGNWADTTELDKLYKQYNAIEGADEAQSSAILSSINRAYASGGTTRNEFNELQNSVANLRGGSVEVQGTWAKIGSTIRSVATDFAAMYGTWQLFSTGTKLAREMFENVKNIDSAMIELKKVTNQTDSQYDSFLTNASKTAISLGSTMSGYISSTADFARLGNSWEDSQELARVASIYNTVGDDLSGIDVATEHIISTMNAFGIEASDAITIVDKLNEVSNKGPISSGGLGEALTRSASSMEAAGNTLDETVGLITAANSVIQDEKTVGQAFKTEYCLCV